MHGKATITIYICIEQLHLPRNLNAHTKISFPFPPTYSHYFNLEARCSSATQIKSENNTVQPDLLCNLGDLGSGVETAHQIFKPLGPGCSKNLHLRGKRKISRPGAIPT